MKRSLTSIWIALCAAAAGWAWHLIGVHHQAAAAQLEPGGLCGPDGGCSKVLASPWAELMGIPVSAPAVPLYLVLAALGAAALAGRLSPSRLAGVASLSGLGGLAFGGWLLYHMVVDIGELCPYCLIMDGANLAVLLLGAALHPEGLLRGLTSAPAAVSRLVRPGPEAAVIPGVLIGTWLVVALNPTPELEEPEDVAVVVEIQPADELVSSSAEVAAEEAIDDGKTKRVVLTGDVKRFELPDSAPTMGPDDAPVTMVLFEDFQCPFCRKLAGNVEALLEETDLVRVAFLHFPMHNDCNAAGLRKDMHPRACAASSAAVCAQEQGQFWAMHDRMFQNQRKLSPSDLRDHAEALGLDMAAFRVCMDAPSTLEKIMDDSRLGAEIGVSGTPTFFLNGRKLSGAQPVASLKAAAEALAAAESDDRILLDVAVEGEVLGAVSGPSAVALEGPRGEFTIDAFESSLDGPEGAAAARSLPGIEPARGLTWYEASAACQAAGKRLCAEDEWLTACTGAQPVDADGDGTYSDDPIQGRPHAYGTWYHEGWCADARGPDDTRPLRTGTHPRCRTPEGVYDLEGVTKEWIGLTPATAGLKGGSYYSGSSARCGYLKDSTPPDTSDPSIGFRCCSGPAPEISEGKAGGQVGDSVFSWSGPTLDGGELGADALAGRPVILTFWASWCGPCREELPALAEVYEAQRAAGGDLEIVAINVDRDQSRAELFLESLPVPFPIVLDADQAIMGRFDASSLPSTFWITRSGLIRQKTTGYSDQKRPELDAAVEALLAAD